MSTAGVSPVPSRSHISYVRSTDYDSQLQKLQTLRAKASSQAWEGMPAPELARSILQRMSSDKLRRMQSVLRRTTSIGAPATVSNALIKHCFSKARCLSDNLISRISKLRIKSMREALCTPAVMRAPERFSLAKQPAYIPMSRNSV